MDELLAAAAQTLNAPISMVERSAAARAAADGVAIEDVLRAWSSGGEIVAGAPAAEPDVPSEVPVAAAEPATAPVPTAPAPALLDDAAIVAAAAEKMGLPESMVKRSAAARAKAQGVDADAVLREWAGVDASGVPPATGSATPVPATTEPPPPPVAAEPDVEILGSADELTVIETVAADPFEPEEEAAAAGAVPRWLAALFVFVPIFAIAYALFLPNGPNCGDAGSLAVDPVTGLAVNCDGSDFGSDFVDLFSLGAEIYEGVGCAACHGPNGGGIATFPAFTGGALLTTFPQDSCSAQIEWISLGTASWPDPTYGANDKLVGGSGAIMPSFAATLSPQEMAAVALYERVAFGGQDLELALVDCGGAPAQVDAAASGE